jgi:hypothetical protein
MIITTHTSLSFDPQIKQFPSMDAAQAHMVKMLVGGGWPKAEAEKAAREAGTPQGEGREYLVADDGDSEVISIRTI